MFEALDTGIRALKPDENPASLNEALAAMARHPCLALSRVPAQQLRAEASLALLDFWNNGGRKWIEEHLRMEREVLAFPPLMRKVMTPATRPAHPALALLCPPTDARCGQETAGWWQRAESYFRLMGAPVPRSRAASSCWPEAQAASPALPAQRYADWLACVEATREVGFAMPLGRLRAPATGWLVIRGRRGHYSYCDEVRMYSLASGAAYVSQDCSELAVGHDTPPAHRRQVVRGSMSVDNLREVAWMLLQLGEAVRGYQNWAGFLIPDGMAPQREPAAAPTDGDEMSVNSAQTTLAWAWTDPAGVVRTSGTLVWPNDYVRGGPGDHAVALLQVAEGGIQEGCPAEKPPQDIGPGAAQPRVSPIDASRRQLNATERELVAALDRAARSECRVARR